LQGYASGRKSLGLPNEKLDFNKNVVGSIFRRIFKSQEVNLDTVACFAAYVANKFIEEYVVSDRQTEKKPATG